LPVAVSLAWTNLSCSEPACLFHAQSPIVGALPKRLNSRPKLGPRIQKKTSTLLLLLLGILLLYP